MNVSRINRFLIAAILASAHTASAATVTVSSLASVDSPDYDLTGVYGVGDWVYWENNAAGGGVPLNSKIGADLIGSMSLVGAGSLAGSTSSTRPVHDFDFTDGVSPLSGGIDNVIGLFNNAFNIVGRGVQVNVIAPTADPFNVYVWAVAFAAQAQLTATVGAATDSGVFAASSSIANRVGRFYTVAVDPDAAGQVVNLSLILSGDFSVSDFSNVTLAAVAVDTAPLIVPAPSAMLSGLVLLPLATLRRPRR